MSNASVWKCARKTNWLGLFLGALIQLGVPFSVGAQTTEIEQLRRELAEHRKFIQSLEKRLEAQEGKVAEATKAAKALPAIEAGYNDGFYIKSQEKPFSMVFNGFGQFLYSNTSPEGGRYNNGFDVALAVGDLRKCFRSQADVFHAASRERFGE